MQEEIKKDLVIFWNFGIRAIAVFLVGYFLSGQTLFLAFKFAGAYLALELGNYYGLFEKLKVLSTLPSNKKGQYSFLFMGQRK